MTMWIAGLIAALAPPVVAAPPASGEREPVITTMPEIIAGGIQYSDYPRLAIRMGLEGLTNATMTVSAAGRVSRCRITRASFAMLDDRVCEIALTRMRFSPATDASGRPIDVEVVLPVQWVLEDRGKPAR